jgi:hypothetical protein
MRASARALLRVRCECYRVRCEYYVQGRSPAPGVRHATFTRASARRNDAVQTEPRPRWLVGDDARRYVLQAALRRRTGDVPAADEAIVVGAAAAHICAGTQLTAITSAPGLGLTTCHIGTGTGPTVVHTCAGGRALMPACRICLRRGLRSYHATACFRERARESSEGGRASGRQCAELDRAQARGRGVLRRRRARSVAAVRRPVDHVEPPVRRAVMLAAGMGSPLPRLQRDRNRNHASWQHAAYTAHHATCWHGVRSAQGDARLRHGTVRHG